MDLVLVKVKGYSGDVMNEMVDDLTKNTSNSRCYFNNRFNYSNRTVRFFPIFKQIPIEYNLRKFIKTLMNTRIIAEWSMLKTNRYEISIAWNITWNLIHRYKRFNCISRKPNIYKDFVYSMCNDNKEEDIYHFIECDANKDLWPIIKNRMQDDDRNIERKDKLNKSESMNRYLKSCHQHGKQSKQDKHSSKKNDLQISQKDQTVVLDDIFELESVQSENSMNENFILSKYYRIGKKAHDQMCLLINNNW
ncbi:hypothetical protein RhiirC2_785367 [Rhizophagus irregularis]|uniref:Uncharacterized protein n=1 Tax=Rhizophagus irregularis TaxID=588596 RepID=A0A2N1MWD9_9GLOM|nr:hypothetical protein RhiirC2_785367 [Rhizophagus irregularis]